MITLGAPWGLLVLVFFVFVARRLLALGARSALRRGVAWLCLAVALSAPEVRWAGGPEPVVLVTDVSRSMSRALPGVAGELASILRRAPGTLPTGVVAFAERAHVVRPPSPGGGDRQADLERLAVDADRTLTLGREERDDTDIAAALTTAARLVGPDRHARIVLATDGWETRGDARQVAATLARRNVAVDVLPVRAWPAGFRDAAIDEVDAPAHVRAGASFDVRAIVRSTVAGRAAVRLVRGASVMAAQEVEVQSGATVVRFSVHPPDDGEHVLTVEVALPGDERPRNDTATVRVTAVGPPRVLWIGRAPIAHPGTAFSVTPLGLDSLGAELPALDGYDVLVLDDVDAGSLPPGAPAAIRRHVAHGGAGFVMLGGPRSFGLGGYRGTPIEDALPVDLDPASRRTRTGLALVLAVDKSGSMADPFGRMSKIDAAREAAVVAASLLEPGDRFGMVVFDAAARVLLPLGAPGAPDEVSRALAEVRPGGGTRLFPAIEAAASMLAPLGGTRRHVVLVTDGRGEGGDFERRGRELAAAGTTLSTVAVGDDADADVLRTLAAAAGGRFDSAREAAKLAAVLRRDVLVARGPVLREGRTRIALTSHPAVAALGTRGVPDVLAYVSTAPKAFAAVPMRADGGDPILALGTHGLGRTAALTTDLAGGWSPAWRGWDGTRAVVAGVLGWAARAPVAGSVSMSQVARGDAWDLAVRVEDAHGDFVNGRRFTARVAGDAERVVALEQRGPGLYAGRLPRRITTPTRVVLEDASAGERRAAADGWIGLGASDEDRLRDPNHALLDEIRRMTGGRWLSAPGELVLRATETHVVRLAPWLAAAALALLLVDIAGVTHPFSRRALAMLRARFAGRARSLGRARAR